MSINNLSFEASFNKLVNFNKMLENCVPAIVVMENQCQVYVINQKDQTSDALPLNELAAKVTEVAERNKLRKHAFDGVASPQEWKDIAAKIRNFYCMAEKMVKQLPKQQLLINHPQSFQGETIEADFDTHHAQMIQRAVNIYTKNLKKMIELALANKQTTIDVSYCNLLSDIPKALLRITSSKTTIQETVHALLEKEFKTQDYLLDCKDLMKDEGSKRLINLKTVPTEYSKEGNDEMAAYQQYLSNARRGLYG